MHQKILRQRRRAIEPAVVFFEEMNEAQWMDEAFALAEQAGAEGEIPIGAVIVDRHGIDFRAGAHGRIGVARRAREVA